MRDRRRGKRLDPQLPLKGGVPPRVPIYDDLRKMKRAEVKRSHPLKEGPQPIRSYFEQEERKRMPNGMDFDSNMEKLDYIF